MYLIRIGVLFVKLKCIPALLLLGFKQKGIFMKKGMLFGMAFLLSACAKEPVIVNLECPERKGNEEYPIKLDINMVNSTVIATIPYFSDKPVDAVIDERFVSFSVESDDGEMLHKLIFKVSRQTLEAKLDKKTSNSLEPEKYFSERQFEIQCRTVVPESRAF